MSSFGSKVPGVGWARPVFQLGRGRTLAVPLEAHATSRKKLCHSFVENGINSGIILVKGGDQESQYDTDSELSFRQDSWFNYLFGAKEPGFYGAISLTNGKSTLFIPKLGPEWKVWCGEIHSPEYFRQHYAVDEVAFVEDLVSWMKENYARESAQGGKIHVIKGVNSDSGLEAKPARFSGDEEFWSSGSVDDAVLYNLISQTRVHKSVEEIEMMRYSAYVASNAHVEVMRIAKHCKFEYELEAKFLYEIYSKGGSRKAAYTSVCACGPNSATLHYGGAGAPNDRELQTTDIALLDMGAEYHGYVSDITCSFPISGKFTADQKIIYEAVLSAQKVVYEHMIPGNSWADCHLRAERAILIALHQAGLLVNGTVDEFVDALLGPVFFPHGLGHLIGCDLHDAGAYIPGTPLRSSRPGLSKLRTARTLEEGMVLTNEPGCYFIDALLEPALADPEKSKFIDINVLARFRTFGGVRIEDVVLVTKNGPECLSTCPRTVEEIESVMSGGPWPPVQDKAPELYRKWTKLASDANSMEIFSL
eukprot:gene10220-11118_t